MRREETQPRARTRTPVGIFHPPCGFSDELGLKKDGPRARERGSRVHLHECFACLPLALDSDEGVRDGEAQALAGEWRQSRATQLTAVDTQAEERDTVWTALAPAPSPAIPTPSPGDWAGSLLQAVVCSVLNHVATLSTWHPLCHLGLSEGSAPFLFHFYRQGNRTTWKRCIWPKSHSQDLSPGIS